MQIVQQPVLYFLGIMFTILLLHLILKNSKQDLRPKMTPGNNPESDFLEFEYSLDTYFDFNYTLRKLQSKGLKVQRQ